MALLIVAGLQGVWIVEQPHTSIIARHRRFRWMVRMWERMGVRVTCENGKAFEQLPWLSLLEIMNTWGLK